MMITQSRPGLALFICFLIVSCSPSSTGKETARLYCASCHQFPEPALLDKATWEEEVLPAMGKLMGVKGISKNPFEEAENINQEASIKREDWQKIVRYYLQAAPEKNAPQARTPIKVFTSRF